MAYQSVEDHARRTVATVARPCHPGADLNDGRLIRLADSLGGPLLNSLDQSSECRCLSKAARATAPYRLSWAINTGA